MHTDQNSMQVLSLLRVDQSQLSPPVGVSSYMVSRPITASSFTAQAISKHEKQDQAKASDF